MGHEAEGGGRLLGIAGVAHDGFAPSFWEYVDEVDESVDAADAGRRLRLCHEALADSCLESPQMALLTEADEIVERLAQVGSIAPDDIDHMRTVAADVRARVERFSLPMQPIHGDAHLGNVIVTARGPVWNDWEDALFAPISWDLGCLHASAPPFGTRDPQLIADAYRGYGRGVDADVLDAFIDPRRFQASVWGVVIGLARGDAGRVDQRLAWLRQRAREAVA